MELKPPQLKCVENIDEYFRVDKKGLIKIFCGSGKSFIIYHLILKYGANLSVVFFPSINLITEFNKNYLLDDIKKQYNDKHFNKDFEVLTVCSKTELGNELIDILTFTTEPDEILDFLKQDKDKIILITYQSVKTLIDIVKEHDFKIDLLCVDKPYYILGNGIKNLLFGSGNGFEAEDIAEIKYCKKFIDGYVEKKLFFTFIPKKSTNINMYESVTEIIIGDKDFEIVNDEEWCISFEKVKKYIDENKKRPSTFDKNKEIQILGEWISTQKNNYVQREQIMKDELIYKKWSDFVSDSKYKEYLLSGEELWYISFEKVKNYIDENKKRPSSTDQQKEIQTLSSWINCQQRKYTSKRNIMKDELIYKKWTDFVSDSKYQKYSLLIEEQWHISLEEVKEYFLSNEKQWYISLQEVKEYIDVTKKRPSVTNRIKEIKAFCKWISHQQTNHQIKQDIMKDEEIRKKWSDFVSDDKYKQYFNNKNLINAYNETTSSIIPIKNMSISDKPSDQKLA
jgi:hypothetical protein